MAPRLLSPELQAEMLARYPHESNAALAEAYGLTAAQIAHIAWERSVRKTPAMRSLLAGARPGAVSIMQRVLAAVKAAGAAGMSRKECFAALPGLPVSNVMDSLASRGYLHGAGPRGATRWFSDPADAAAHAQATGAPARSSKSQRALARRQHRAGLPPMAATAPAATPTATPLMAVEPPESAASALFRTLGAGQYLDTAPRSWVAAATNRRT